MAFYRAVKLSSVDLKVGRPTLLRASKLRPKLLAKIVCCRHHNYQE
jgi:hypothetical protein